MLEKYVSENFILNYRVIRKNQTFVSFIKNIISLMLDRDLDYLYCKFGKIKYHHLLKEETKGIGDFLI